MDEYVCVSCKKKITTIEGSVSFPCPSCTKTTIIRCGHCRAISAPYRCSSCNFEGP
ncbi:MAG: zinc finger domain-containing protein [Candidatus Woesearchaeota archaeon]